MSTGKLEKAARKRGLRRKPTGHVAFVRRDPRTGRAVQVRAKGVRRISPKRARKLEKRGMKLSKKLMKLRRRLEKFREKLSKYRDRLKVLRKKKLKPKGKILKIKKRIKRIKIRLRKIKARIAKVRLRAVALRTIGDGDQMREKDRRVRPEPKKRVKPDVSPPQAIVPENKFKSGVIQAGDFVRINSKLNPMFRFGTVIAPGVFAQIVKVLGHYAQIRITHPKYIKVAPKNVILPKNPERTPHETFIVGDAPAKLLGKFHVERVRVKYEKKLTSGEILVTAYSIIDATVHLEALDLKAKKDWKKGETAVEETRKEPIALKQKNGEERYYKPWGGLFERKQ